MGWKSHRETADSANQSPHQDRVLEVEVAGKGADQLQGQQLSQRHGS